MARRVCGTCRHFRPDDQNRKHGWCGHPLKQTTTDVRIRVRYGELNCRNDWDNDLWQLREDGDRVLDVSMMSPTTPPGERPSASARTEERRTLGQDAPRESRPLPPPADVVIEEGLTAPRLVSEEIDRELLRKAREQYRSRRQPSRPSGPPLRSDDAPPSRLHRSEPIVISNEVQPLQIGVEPGPDLTRVDDQDRPRPRAAELGAETAPGRFSSVPAVESAFELPQRPVRRSEPPRRVDDFEMVSLRDYEEARESPRPASPTEDLGDDDYPHRANDVVDGAHWESVGEDERIDRGVSSDGIPMWGHVEPRRPRMSESHAREEFRAAPPSMSQLWDDIPRCCRTCRDFRAAESGSGGGWCTNRWAFRHRRMVDIDQLTCETSIGDWWLPSDDAWRDDLDVGRHAMSTPLMDRWFGRQEEEPDVLYPMVANRTRRRS